MKRMKKKGVALVSVLLILTSMMVLTLGFAAFTTTDYAISQAYYSSLLTFYLSNSGLEYFTYLMKHNMLVFPLRINTDLNTPYTYENYPQYTKRGQCVNVYDANGDEQLVLSSITCLDWGTIGDLFLTNRQIGTFNIKAVEKQDDNAADANKRVLYVRSIGKIREIPSATSAAQDPKTGNWAYWNDATFKVRAQRTLFMRVPFGQMQYITDVVAGTNPTYYEVLTDGWYERYR